MRFARFIRDGRSSYGLVEGDRIVPIDGTPFETWQQAGDNARQIFVAQKLTGLVTTLMGTVGDVSIDKLTVVDSQLTRNGSSFAASAAVTNEQLKQTLGVDIAQVVRNLGDRGLPAGGSVPAPPPPPRRRDG